MTARPQAIRSVRARERARTLEEDFQFLEKLQIAILVTPPIIAGLVWPMVADSVRTFLNNNAGQAVDGNAFAVQLLRPTVNGIVLPTLSVALGTLLATTINVLRNRQVEIRACLNKESCELRLLRAALLGAFGTAQHAERRAEALDLCRGYCARVVAESSVGAFEEVRKEERAGGVGVNELENLGRMLHGVDGAYVRGAGRSFRGRVAATPRPGRRIFRSVETRAARLLRYAARQQSVGACLNLVASLNQHRSDRLAALLGAFPPIHWFFLCQLGFSIIAAFLIESNQEVLQFLNSLQLRVLFALLIAVCSGTATLCFDLSDPFRGRFSVVTATQQITRLEDLLVDDVEAAERLADDDDGDFSLGEAIKFHLLTSAYAAPVRAVGDVASYAARPLVRRRRRRRRPPAGEW